MKKILTASILLIAANAAAQHPNILISMQNFPNEPAIQLDPRNTNRMIAGTNIANVYYSTDAGQTWSEIVQSSSFGVWGDPVFAVDTAGDFYHFHLSNPPFGSWIDRIVCQKSTNGGSGWNDGSFTGLNGTKAQDKQWVSIDRSNNHIYMTWTEFDAYGSFDPQDSSRILFSRSTDGGSSWSAPRTVSDRSGDCIDSDNTTEGAMPAVGPNGEVYVAWAFNDTIWFDRSSDGGTTWLPSDIFVSTQPGGWDFPIPGIMRCNGLPVTVCDTSSASPHNGTIYVNWTDQRSGSADTDVWLVRSTDGGNTWSSPLRVNDDAPGKHQFFTWMTIDQSNGNLWFVFYDRRDHSNELTDVYLAFSNDGGNTFENFRISESPFLPDATVFFGDYTNITAHNEVVRPIWTRLDTADLSVYTALVNTGLVGVDEQNEAVDESPYNFPNPFRKETYVSFKLKKTSTVTLTVYDMQGNLVKRPLDAQTMAFGKQLVTLDLSGFPPGLYFYTLDVDGVHQVRKIISVK